MIAATQETRYIPAREQASLIRKSLKESFPAIKFSVRKQSGSSIDIRWQDGPTIKQVEAVVSRFAGGYFDGMTDYAGGYVSMYKGEPVHFAASYIFCKRDFSAAFMTKLVDRFHHRYGWYDTPNGHGMSTCKDVPRPVYVDRHTEWSDDAEIANYSDISKFYFASRDMGQFYRSMAHDRSDGTIARNSATAKLVGSYRRSY
jgi:hypothetical protein